LKNLSFRDILATLSSNIISGVTPTMDGRKIKQNRKLRYLLPVVAALFFAGFVNAQAAFIRVDRGLVAVPVSVLDRGGRYISTLKKEDFKIVEDDVEQEIDLFETTDGSVTVLMLLERSGAIRNQLSRLVDAANAFVRQMRPEDRFIAISFGRGSDTIIKETKIKDVPKGNRIVAKVGDSSPFVYEAVDAALEKIQKITGRKAVVIFSEGIDPAYYLSPSAKGNLKASEESGATIYTVKFNTEIQLPPWVKNKKPFLDNRIKAKKYMTDLADKTGGRAFQIEQIDDLDSTFSEVASELIRQYTLGYSPGKPGSNGERRRIRVQVNFPNAVVRARKDVVYKKNGK